MSAPSFPPPRNTDPAAFGRVAVLMGGTSSEREVSLNSGRNVLEALQARGVQAHAVDGLPALLEQIRAGAIDRVFNILHGGDGENGVLQGLLTALKVPFTGPGVLGCALTLDKIRTKQVWIASGLPTPAFRRIRRGDDLRAAAAELGLPVFVKPSTEGSSVGVFRVLAEQDLQPAIDFAAGYDGELLIEQMVQGEEYTVGILDGVALPSIRIVPAGAWYDYHAKYIAEDTQYLCPGLSGQEEIQIRRLSLAAFESAACSGWGRVDVMRDVSRGLQLIEVNTAPGMTSHSLVPKAARQAGIGFEELCWRILESTLQARPA
ncbi:D-alanine--D-alanine ligase [Pseudoxanthomonas spadix]|uniref:D-alanine--D-alanine ligase n=1 Tax=Pseudoxanthomonas spadix TaxID=415229 RepID=UPI000EFF1BD7|nr:D-alanine--D-alanine ligase [Pseudoxanthomonas spadix]MBP3973998.1 D-alanine--D-alanine ligase [Pseudoxanthomonas spadix]RMW95171.1 D-alanine--D-alanine ligase [Pseudoxanthomonas spadix]